MFIHISYPFLHVHLPRLDVFTLSRRWRFCRSWEKERQKWRCFFGLLQHLPTFKPYRALRYGALCGRPIGFCIAWWYLDRNPPTVIDVSTQQWLETTRDHQWPCWRQKHEGRTRSTVQVGCLRRWSASKAATHRWPSRCLRVIPGEIKQPPKTANPKSQIPILPSCPVNEPTCGIMCIGTRASGRLCTFPLQIGNIFWSQCPEQLGLSRDSLRRRSWGWTDLHPQESIASSQTPTPTALWAPEKCQQQHPCWCILMYVLFPVPESPILWRQLDLLCFYSCQRPTLSNDGLIENPLGIGDPGLFHGHIG